MASLGPGFPQLLRTALPETQRCCWKPKRARVGRQGRVSVADTCHCTADSSRTRTHPLALAVSVGRSLGEALSEVPAQGLSGGCVSKGSSGVEDPPQVACGSGLTCQL